MMLQTTETMKKVNTLAFGTVTLLLLGAGQVDAQIPAGPRELGMGGAYMGVARGYESVFLAPANLALLDGPNWSLGFPQVAVGGSVSGPELTDFIDIVDYDDLEDSRQDELLGLFDNGTEGSFAFRAPLLTFSSGSFGLGVSYSALGSHTLSQDLAELFLEGYEDGRTDYSVGDTYGQRATFWDFAASYARNIAGISVGGTAHYIMPRTLVRTRLFEPQVDLEAQDVTVNYVGVISKGGSGYSLDLGAAFKPHPSLTVSGAVSNVTSQINWSEDLYVRDFTLDRDIIDNATPQDILNRYEATEAPLDPTAVPLRVFEAAELLYDEAYLPAVSRLGVAWSPAARTHIAADVHNKLTEGRLAEAWDQRISVGVQQSLWILGLRAGYSTANDGGNMVTGGFSLGPLDVGVAKYQQKDAGDIATRGWIATFGLGMDQNF